MFFLWYTLYSFVQLSTLQHCLCPIDSMHPVLLYCVLRGVCDWLLYCFALLHYWMFFCTQPITVDGRFSEYNETDNYAETAANMTEEKWGNLPVSEREKCSVQHVLRKEYSCKHKIFKGFTDSIQDTSCFRMWPIFYPPLQQQLSLAYGQGSGTCVHS